MSAGKLVKLRTPTLAIDVLGGKRVAVTAPAGTLIKVVSGPTDGDRLVDVLWEGLTYLMLTDDVTERGTEITGRGAYA
jgi:hypothetical protein